MSLEPIKEAGILEGCNGIKETCLQIPIIMHVVEVPVDVCSTSNVQSPREEPAHMSGEQGSNGQSDVVVLEESALPKCLQINCDTNKDSLSVRLDLSFKSPSHTGQSDVVVLEESALPKCLQINYDTNKDSISVRPDLGFKSPSHTGLQATELVKKLTEQFPAAMPLALVLKKFLAERSVDQSYSGG